MARRIDPTGGNNPILLAIEAYLELKESFENTRNRAKTNSVQKALQNIIDGIDEILKTLQGGEHEKIKEILSTDGMAVIEKIKVQARVKNPSSWLCRILASIQSICQ